MVQDLETELGILVNAWVERIGISAVIDALDFYVIQLENRNELEVVDLKNLRASLRPFVEDEAPKSLRPKEPQ